MGLEDDVFPVVADIEGAIAELGARIKAFGSETFEQLPSVQAQAYLVTWNAFVEDFNAWRTAWWANPFRRRNEVLAYRKRFNSLQEFFQGLTGAVATTTPVFTAQQITGASLIPSWVMPVALGLGGLMVFAQVWPALGSLRSLVPRTNPRRRRRRR